jgi:outer membrane biosynthesis protein TonB
MYYVGVDQLAVYSEPKPSSSRLTQLPLHQKVYRYKMEKGYAYIKVEGSEVTGWVDNAQLIWRLPSQQQKAPPKAEERATKPEPEAPVAKEKAPTPTTAAEAAEPEPTPTAAEPPAEQKPTSPAAAPTSVAPAQSAPAAPSAPRPIGPSIFNPF